MDERLYSAIVAELQGMALPEDRWRRAAAAAAPVQQKISLSALARLGFDDSPFDYPAFLIAAQRSPEAK
jgi:hypothetical protein